MKTKIFDNVEKTVRETVINGLNEYNYKHANRDVQEYTICIYEDDKIIGGAIGSTYWDWLFVKLLWVDKAYRNKGIGNKIMNKVEKIAIKRSCIGIHLDTFSFQAQKFYEKLGYEPFGIINNHPIGHKRIFMKKEIAQIT